MQKAKNTRLMSLSCVMLVALIAVAVAPLVFFYWNDILRFLEGALPPHHNTTALNDTEVGSGEAGSGVADATSLRPSSGLASAPS